MGGMPTQLSGRQQAGSPVAPQETPLAKQGVEVVGVVVVVVDPKREQLQSLGPD